MTKKKIDRLSVIHKREINWLKWYFLKSERDPMKSKLEEMIEDAAKKSDDQQLLFLIVVKSATEEMIERSDKKTLEAIKKVYVYQYFNVERACRDILFVGTTLGYKIINEWFDTYFMMQYRYIPIKDR